MKLAIDTCILSKICHPGKNSNKEICAWFSNVILSGEYQIYIAAIVDYEIRRGLLHLTKTGQESQKSITRLDTYISDFDYIPLDRIIMNNAAELWADARSKGISTADQKALDADVILAAQAKSVNAIVVTDNVRHLGKYIMTKKWNELA